MSVEARREGQAAAGRTEVGQLVIFPVAAASDALASLAGNNSDAHLAGLAADAALRRGRRAEGRGGGRV